MPSLKDLKNRIESVKSTRKITRAMQMVAAAKLRRAQDAAVSARPYAARFDAVLARLAGGVAQGGDVLPLLAGTGRSDVHLLVVMTSERGLCGAFNANIAKRARARAHELLARGKTVKILTVGKKGRDALRRDLGDRFIAHIDLGGQKAIGHATARDIARAVLDRFEGGEFDVATIFFSRFRSVISQEPADLQVIPAAAHADGHPQAPPAETAQDTAAPPCDYEPGEHEILADLLPRWVGTRILSGLLENAASEQGARMSAMDNATRNAGEMIDKLTIQFNRSRQAVITNELIEIISGAEAL